MTERLAGIQVHEEAGSGQSITESPTAVTAFVGRCLRGPVHRPVTLGSFADYQRIFGGLWQPSMLSYAIEQFFENGGRSAIVVKAARLERKKSPSSMKLSFAPSPTASAAAPRKFSRNMCAACI